MKDVISEITPGRDDDGIFLPPATTTARTLNKFQPKPRGKPNKPITAASLPFAVTSNAGAGARAGAGQEEAFLTEKGNPGQDAPVAECTESIVAPISEPSSAVAPIAGSSNLALAEEAAHVMGAPEVDTEVPAVFDMEDDLLVDPSGPTGLLNGLSSTERAVGKFRPKRHPKTTKLIPSFSNSDDNTLQHASPTEDIEASKLGSVNCEPVGFSSQDIETQESLNITKGSSTHEGNCQDGPQVFENKNNLQTDPDRPEEEAIPVLSGMESHDGLLSQSSDAAAVKQASIFQPKSALRPRKQKAKSVSFSLPDAAETAAAHVRDHSDVLADDSTVTEPFSISMMHDESLDNLPHTTSVISDNVTLQLDQGDARKELDLADLSGLESFDSILPEPASVTGQTVPKFQPKRGARAKTLKSNNSGDTDGAKEYMSSQWDFVSMDADPLTNLATEQADPVERSSLEVGSPGGNEVFETIDTPPSDRDNYIGGKEKFSAGSEDTGNELKSWDDEERTNRASEEHEASKSSRRLRKRAAAGSPGELDNGISENSNYSQMDENHDDDEYRGEPKKRKQPKRSKKMTTDAKKPAKRHRKTSKGPESIKTEPPKKKFPHGIRRGRRQVDKALLETPEYEDRNQIVLRQLIRLGEANERNASKEAAALKNNQSNNGSFSNGINFVPNNPHDEDLDPYGEEAHWNMHRNSKINYQTHMRKPQRGKWSKSETESFYEALRQFGTDFGMIEKLFPNRTRHQVKLKFKNEERKHPAELHDAMSHRSKDLSHFEKVIQQLKAQAEEESRLDGANDVADVNEEERDQREKEPEKVEHEANGFDGKVADSEKHNEWDADGATDYNEYESVDWDVGVSSPKNDENYAEYDEFY